MKFLQTAGFEVVECTTAEAAELMIASTGTELRALITDHNLAGEISGADLAQYARQRFPQMNIVVMSGTTVKPLPAAATFLQKPFPPERFPAGALREHVLRRARIAATRNVRVPLGRSMRREDQDNGPENLTA